MEIAIISDTHMPRGPRRLPTACVARLRAADLIVHAGDLNTLEVLDELRALGEVVAVHGNVDDAGVRAALPASAQVAIGALRLAVIHDGGPGGGAWSVCDAAFRRPTPSCSGTRTSRCSSGPATDFRSSTRAARPSAGARRTTRWRSGGRTPESCRSSWSSSTD